MKGPFTVRLCHLAEDIDVPSRVATNINGRDLPVELELFFLGLATESVLTSPCWRVSRTPVSSKGIWKRCFTVIYGGNASLDDGEQHTTRRCVREAQPYLQAWPQFYNLTRVASQEPDNLNHLFPGLEGS